MRGCPTAGLDVYKRQEHHDPERLEYRHGFLERHGSSRFGPGPVSYTHLDVYKRQPLYSAALFDMVANPRSATVMGLLEEARTARARGHKAAAQAGSMKNMVTRAKDWFLGNF